MVKLTGTPGAIIKAEKQKMKCPLCGDEIDTTFDKRRFRFFFPPRQNTDSVDYEFNPDHGCTKLQGALLILRGSLPK